jgi:hypothetical protein
MDLFFIDKKVAKILWVAIGARSNLLPTLSYLTCQVKCQVNAPGQDDMKKLIFMLGYV